MNIQLQLGDCIERLKEMEDNSIGAMISDPPYDLVSGGETGFMGKEWDGTGIAFSQELWTEIYRVLKPKGIVKSFGGTRTFHRMASAMEQAGFTDISIEAWTYGSGFPKSLNIGKSFDKQAGVEREVVGWDPNARIAAGSNKRRHEQGTRPSEYHQGTGCAITAPTTEDAKVWDGWGTALKPAWEPVCVGYKP